MIPAFVNDHRGARVPFVANLSGHALGVDLNAEQHATLREILEEGRWGRRLNPPDRLIMFIAFPVVAMIWVIRTLTRANRPAHFGGAVLVLIVIFGTAFVWGHWRYRRKVYPKLSMAWVTFGHCGACCYDLCETQREPDGCRVCPECGAAWRMPES